MGFLGGAKEANDAIIRQTQRKWQAAGMGRGGGVCSSVHARLDQTQTDFRKGRSRAIQAAKDALEENGFALPEPIYRVRFDGISLDEAAYAHEIGTRRADRAEFWSTAEDRLNRELEITKTLKTPVNFIVHTLQEVNAGLNRGALLLHGHRA